MKIKWTAVLLAAMLGCSMLAGCGAGGSKTQSAAEETAQTSGSASDTSENTFSESSAAGEAAIEDGTYLADFKTDSTMFHLNEMSDGKGILTVKDGEMSVHITLVSKSIVNLYYGSAEDAQKEGAELIDPTMDSVTYKDGMTEEVNGYDVPVPALDEDYTVAIIGTHGNWYDHIVSVSNPVPYDGPVPYIGQEDSDS